MVLKINELTDGNKIYFFYLMIRFKACSGTHEIASFSTRIVLLNLQRTKQ